MIEVTGWGRAVNGSFSAEWDANANPTDWRGWIKGTPATAAVSGSILEVEVDWAMLVPDKQLLFATVHALGFDGSWDAADYALSSSCQGVLVTQTPVPANALSAGNEPLLQ